MKISIIIPTLNRPGELAVLLDSIVEQTKKPVEIIIVDQSDNRDTQQSAQEFKNDLPIRYFHFNEKSGAKSRNFGINRATGEIIAFLDDDTKLTPGYLYQIERFFGLFPDAIGGMGKIINYREFRAKLFVNEKVYKLHKILSSFFGLNSSKEGFLVLRSSRNTEQYDSEQTINTEWLSTCNCWYKKNIFTEFMFEERFEKWSFGEDRMLSHQIFKKYPAGLYFHPDARLYHFESPESRMADKNKIFMKVIYQFWFFHSCIKRHPFFYWWANMGEIIMHFINSCIGREHIADSYYYILANLRLMSNLKKVKAGNFSELIK